MTYIIQRAASRGAVPWRNGKGVQYEVTADGPLPDGWSWRLSTADLSTDVPFSDFSGVSREFCVAIGNGVDLSIDGISTRCGPGSIMRFDGGSKVHASIIDGPTKDINLMVKHGSPGKHLSTHVGGEWVSGVDALVALGGGARIIVDDQDIELDPLDAVLSLGQHKIFIVRGSIITVQ